MAGATRIKVYAVQCARPDGTIEPAIVAVKLTHLAAHTVAKRLAPAKVISLVADKSDELNGEPLNAASPAAAGADNGPRWHQQG
jgi:hypothetical protein